MFDGGYVIIGKTDNNIYEKSKKALTLGKPILFYEDATTSYYIDAITLDGSDNVVLTKGGKTITIANDNTITESGNVDDKLYCHSILLYNTGTKNRVTFLLFDKNGSSYNTLAKVETALKKIATDADTTIYIMLSGIYEGNEALYYVVQPAGTIGVAYKDDNEATGVNSVNITITTLFNQVNDGLNELI